MTPWLASRSVALKLDRARHHQRELVDLIANHYRPFELTEDYQTAATNGKSYRVVRAVGNPPPPELGLILGDVVQNLRATLDYAVTAMRSGGATRSSGYPILGRPATDFADFEERTAGKLAGVPVEAKQVIFRLQTEPYPTATALPELDCLWNVDKHRTLLVATPFTRALMLGRSKPDPDDPSGYRVIPSEHAAEWWLPTTNPDETFEPRFQADLLSIRPPGTGLWITSLEQRDVSQMVERFIRQVTDNVLSELARFIGPDASG